jgi:hypothetical protein
MLKGHLLDLQRFLARRRGDCFGAVAAGLFFVRVAPNTESAEAFGLLGTTLALTGAALSLVAVGFTPGSKDA